MLRNCFFLSAGLLAIGLVGCSMKGPGSVTANDNAIAASERGAGNAVGLSISTLNNPFFGALRDGAQAEAATKNIQLLTVDAQDDPAKQIADVEDLIQKKVRVILINPTDSDAVANAVKQAVAAGVKVVSLDRRVIGAEVSAHIASDNVAGGKMAAQFLTEQIGGKGNIVELEGIPGSSAARERGRGFDSVINGKAGVKVIGRQPADFDRAKGLSVMENILQSHRNIQGVFAQNDEMALGAEKAIEASGLKGVVIVGFDATPDAMAAVRSGKLAATVQQMPAEIGKMGVDTARLLMDGQQVAKSIPVELSLIKR